MNVSRWILLMLVFPVPALAAEPLVGLSIGSKVLNRGGTGASAGVTLRIEDGAALAAQAMGAAQPQGPARLLRRTPRVFTYTARRQTPPKPAAPAVARQRLFSTGRVIYAEPEALRKTVDLEVDNLGVEDAVRQVIQKVAPDMTVTMDKDLPTDIRVTVRAQKVRVSTALDLITQAAGGGWAVETKGGKPTIRIGKDVRRPVATLAESFAYGPDASHWSVLAPQLHGDLLQYMRVTEERSTYTCPHCKARVVMVTQREQPKCEKCGRLFQKEWQFCPVDGSKRPADTGAWKFCPCCGKEVQPASPAVAPAR